MIMTELSKPSISLVVAALKPNLGIGYQGKMPWRLRKEIKYFKDVTCKVSNPTSQINAVIMGRKTWESIPKKFRPLPDRINVVLSRGFPTCEVIEENIIHANSLDESLKYLSKSDHNRSIERIFVIGGAEIYNTLIDDPRTSHLLLTEIETDKEIPVDTYLKFPLYDENTSWIKQSKQELQSFVGDEIILEDDIKEGDFVYNYTLWKRK
ncbi:dihydrofolate reductase [Scheffersomyces amazonensis]|uniref:dihydrofolate reductase n=1 Tax=Scheffersomyces amazonensis TaxID=1078765 RepID=UPI00315DC0CC